MTQYFRKREVVDAVQYLGWDSIQAMQELCGDCFDYDECSPDCSLICHPTASVLTRRGRSWRDLYESNWVLKHSDGFEILNDEEFQRDWVKAVSA